MVQDTARSTSRSPRLSASRSPGAQPVGLCTELEVTTD